MGLLQLQSVQMEKKVYAVNEGSNDVSVIDTVTNQVIATVTVGYKPLAIATVPVENYPVALGQFMMGLDSSSEYCGKTTSITGIVNVLTGKIIKFA